MKCTPFSFDINLTDDSIKQFDRRLERRLSALHGQFNDEQAYRKLADDGDPLVYEVLEIRRPEVAGELLCGLSILHPGKVGREYFMTKGHFHSVRLTAEVYCCLRGYGALVMENESGDWVVKELRPGSVVYVTPGFAHRSVNLSENENFITFFIYPGNAGHDYGRIESTGFRKLILEKHGKPEVVDNPAWARATGVEL